MCIRDRDYKGSLTVVYQVKYPGYDAYQFYSYKGLKMHRQGKGCLGFESYTVMDNAPNGKKVENYFECLAPYYIPLPHRTKVFSNDDDPISTSTSYSTIEVIDPVRKIVSPYSCLLYTSRCV